MVSGLLPTTRMRYLLPVAVAKGTVALMVPLPIAVTVPMLTGLAKVPKLSLNCAVNVLPAVKGVQPMEYGTDILPPGHSELLVTPVVMRVLVGLYSEKSVLA